MAEQLAVTIPEAAALVDVGRSTGYALAASGEWPTIRIGRSVRVPLTALRLWVERQTRGVEDPAPAASPNATPPASAGATRVTSGDAYPRTPRRRAPVNRHRT